MTKTKNANLQEVLDVITNFVEGQLSKLPPEIAEAKRKQVSQILSSATRSAHKKNPKPTRPRTKRPPGRPRSKSS
jgi:hypothetical protein